jgi:hypothetical protein
MRSCGRSSSSSRLAGREAEPEADNVFEELAEAIASSGPTPSKTPPVPDLWWMPDLSRPCGRAVPDLPGAAGVPPLCISGAGMAVRRLLGRCAVYAAAELRRGAAA